MIKFIMSGGWWDLNQQKTMKTGGGSLHFLDNHAKFKKLILGIDEEEDLEQYADFSKRKSAELCATLEYWFIPFILRPLKYI
jgi:hypothetical protein